MLSALLSRRSQGLAVGVILTGAALIPIVDARGQAPPPPADAPLPGAAAVEGTDVVVTRAGRVQLKIRCFEGDVPCTGSVRITTTKPVSPGKGKPRKQVTIASGSYGELASGQVKTITLKLRREAAPRVRGYRTTAVQWEMYWPDGSRQRIFVPNGATVTSRLAP